VLLVSCPCFEWLARDGDTDGVMFKVEDEGVGEFAGERGECNGGVREVYRRERVEVHSRQRIAFGEVRSQG